jgi:hypothetical protein
LVIAQEAMLAIHYPQDALRTRKNIVFAQVLSPLQVFHPNVAPGPVQILCLGSHVPLGIRLVEILMLCHRALTLQDVQRDEFDAAGVLNLEAARWWQQCTLPLPLVDAPFLATPAPVEATP